MAKLTIARSLLEFVEQTDFSDDYRDPNEANSSQEAREIECANRELLISLVDNRSTALEVMLALLDHTEEDGNIVFSGPEERLRRVQKYFHPEGALLEA